MGRVTDLIEVDVLSYGLMEGFIQLDPCVIVGV